MVDQSLYTQDLECLPELYLDNQLCFSLYSLSRLVTQSYTPLLKPLDLTYPQYLVMLVLWQFWEQGEYKLAINKMTERLKLDTGTVTPLLKRMEAKELLSRQRSEKDERMVMVSLSEKGLKLRTHARNVPNALMCNSKVNAEQVSELRESLKTMLSILS